MTFCSNAKSPESCASPIVTCASSSTTCTNGPAGTTRFTVPPPPTTNVSSMESPLVLIAMLTSAEAAAKPSIRIATEPAMLPARPAVLMTIAPCPPVTANSASPSWPNSSSTLSAAAYTRSGSSCDVMTSMTKSPLSVWAAISRVTPVPLRRMNRAAGSVVSISSVKAPVNRTSSTAAVTVASRFAVTPWGVNAMLPSLRVAVTRPSPKFAVAPVMSSWTLLPDRDWDCWNTKLPVIVCPSRSRLTPVALARTNGSSGRRSISTSKSVSNAIPGRRTAALPSIVPWNPAASMVSVAASTFTRSTSATPSPKANDASLTATLTPPVVASNTKSPLSRWPRTVSTTSVPSIRTSVLAARSMPITLSPTRIVSLIGEALLLNASENAPPASMPTSASPSSIVTPNRPASPSSRSSRTPEPSVTFTRSPVRSPRGKLTSATATAITGSPSAVTIG